MPLRNTAYIVFPNPEDNSDNTDLRGEGVFELQGVEATGELEREMLLGNRGQTISEISSVVPGVPKIGDDGAGLNVDGGAGRDTWRLNFEMVKTEESTRPDPTWGDGTVFPPGDASDDHPQTQAQIFKYWCRVTRFDSGSPVKLHWGEWTDGRFDEYGSFDEPIPTVVQSVTIEEQRDDPSARLGTVELLRTSELPEFVTDQVDNFEETLDDFVGDVQTEIENISKEIGD